MLPPLAVPAPCRAAAAARGALGGLPAGSVPVCNTVRRWAATGRRRHRPASTRIRPRWRAYRAGASRDEAAALTLVTKLPLLQPENRGSDALRRMERGRASAYPGFRAIASAGPPRARSPAHGCTGTGRGPSRPRRGGADLGARSRRPEARDAPALCLPTRSANPARRAYAASPRRRSPPPAVRQRSRRLDRRHRDYSAAGSESRSRRRATQLRPRTKPEPDVFDAVMALPTLVAGLRSPARPEALVLAQAVARVQDEASPSPRQCPPAPAPAPESPDARPRRRRQRPRRPVPVARRPGGVATDVPVLVIVTAGRLRGVRRRDRPRARRAPQPPVSVRGGGGAGRRRGGGGALEGGHHGGADVDGVGRAGLLVPLGGGAAVPEEVRPRLPRRDERNRE